MNPNREGGSDGRATLGRPSRETWDKLPSGPCSRQRREERDAPQRVARDDAFLHAWLLRATLNRCRDLARSWWRRHAQSFDALGIEVPQAEKDDAPWTDAQLWEAVQRLPERYRAVVHLRYVEQLPADAIAAACGISESAVRTRLSRAMRKLRVHLGGMS